MLRAHCACVGVGGRRERRLICCDMIQQSKMASDVFSMVYLCVSLCVTESAELLKVFEHHEHCRRSIPT